jgi:phage protein D
LSSGDQHAPSFLVHINNTRISAEREAEIKEIVINDRINAPSSFRIIAADPENLWREKDEYYIGSKIKISLGYKDDMEELFSGDITALSCAYKRGEAVEITITGYNPLHKLKRFKRYQAFTEKKVKDIVTELADGASLSADAENLSYEHPFTVQNEMSDFEYLLALAERYDCFFSVKDTTLSFKRLKKNSSENLTLEYGKTLLEFRPIVETSRIISEVEVHAWNPAKHEAITGKAKYGDIDAQGGKVVNDSLGGGKAAFTDAYALDQNGADQLAKDILARNTREYVSGDAATYGNIKIRAGAIVKIEGVAKKYAGKYFIVAAQHRIVPMTYRVLAPRRNPKPEHNRRARRAHSRLRRRQPGLLKIRRRIRSSRTSSGSSTGKM